MLDVLFALERSSDRFVRLEIDQRFDAVSLGETLGQTLAMLVTRRTRLFVIPTYSVPPGLLARMYTQ
jgi:hypothetical protein